MGTYDMPEHFPASGNDEDAVVRDLLRTILDQIRWVAGIAGAVILASIIYAKTATPVYSADALIQVEPQTGNNTNSGSPTQASLVPSAGVMHTDAEIEIIKSRAVIEPVVDQFGLDVSTSPHTLPVLGKLTSMFASPGHPLPALFGMRAYAWGGEQFSVDSIAVPKPLEGARLVLRALGDGRYELLDPYGHRLLDGIAGKPASGNGVTMRVNTLAARAGTEFFVTRLNPLDAVARLSSNLRVAEKGRETGVVQLSYMGSDPQAITAIANAITASYLRQRTERAQEEASRMLTFLNNELPRLRAEVHQAETALSEYQSRVGSFQPTQEASLYLSGGLDYEKQIASLRIMRAQLLQRFTAESPEVKTVDAQLAALSAEKDRFDQHFKTLPGSERNAVALQRNAKVAEEIYVALLNRTQELSISRAGSIGNVHILDDALLPSAPVRPKAALIVSAGTVLGVIAGILFAFCRRKLFTGVTDPEFIERRFRMPIFGSIVFSTEQAQSDRLSASERPVLAGGAARMPAGVLALPGPLARLMRPRPAAAESGTALSVGPRRRKTRSPARALLATTRPFDPSVEGLRGLRATLQFSLADAPNRIVAMTSPAPSDGKSFLCANLAALIAESGKRVLLIEADLRRGSLRQYFGRSAHGGLTELLRGQTGFERAARPTHISGLHFMAAGAYPPNPSEILTSRRLIEVLQRAEQEFDIVLVDTPPLLAVADAAIVANVAGSTVLVIRSGAHTERHIADSLRKLQRARARLVGGVMNAVPQKSAGRYGAYDYAYAYAYSVNDPIGTDVRG